MEGRSNLGSDIATGIMVFCALGVLGMMAHREFMVPTAAARGVDRLPTHQVPSFDTIAAVGHRLGPNNAPVTIVEFADFECPVCRHFEQTTLQPVERAFPGEVAVVFRHWPLSYHRFAMPAARAAECAGAQGRFRQFHDLIYAKQDSLGLKSFTAFAAESGVTDTAAFDKCNESSDKMPAIDRDVAMAKSLKMFGTPSLIVNGLLLGGTPDSVALDSVVRAQLHGRSSAGR